MKLTKKQLMNLIKEAIKDVKRGKPELPYHVVSPRIHSKKSMPHIQRSRKAVRSNPEFIEKANQLKQAKGKNSAAYAYKMGADIDEFTKEQPYKVLKKDDKRYGYGKYIRAGGPKDIAMEIEEAIIEYVQKKGIKVNEYNKNHPYFHKEDIKHVIMPLDSVYNHFIRNENLSEEVIDRILEYSYEMIIEPITVLGEEIQYLAVPYY